MKVKIFNTETDTTFEFFQDNEDWNGMHQQIGIESYLEDMTEIIKTVVKNNVETDHDKKRMIAYMKNDLIELIEEMVERFRKEEIEIEEN